MSLFVKLPFNCDYTDENVFVELTCKRDHRYRPIESECQTAFNGIVVWWNVRPKRRMREVRDGTVAETRKIIYPRFN